MRISLVLIDFKDSAGLPVFSCLKFGNEKPALLRVSVKMNVRCRLAVVDPFRAGR